MLGKRAHTRYNLYPEFIPFLICMSQCKNFMYQGVCILTYGEGTLFGGTICYYFYDTTCNSGMLISDYSNGVTGNKKRIPERDVHDSTLLPI